MAPDDSTALALIESIGAQGALADGRGRAAKPLHLEVLREVTQQDLEELSAARQTPSAPAHVPTILELRHSHHMLARALAEGNSLQDASYLTGYSVDRIATLKGSPMFQELIAHYSSQENSKEIDFKRRIAQLGFSAADEMQRRIDETPQEISFAQLRETAEMAFNAAGLSASAKGSAQAPTGIPNISINFVESTSHAASAPLGASMVDITAVTIEETSNGEG